MSLRRGLARMRGKLADALSAEDEEQLYRQLERGLLAADAGTSAARSFVAATRKRAGSHPSLAEAGSAVRAEFASVLDMLSQSEHRPQAQPHVVMLIGANGSGKTTTAAKLAKHAVAQGKRVVLGACDTFRAAAPEQLEAWAQRLGERVRIVIGAKDPAAVAYNAVTAAAAAGEASLAIIDTAGRQSNNRALMAEAAKIKRAAGKALAGAPHEIVLTIDANTGQNALAQLASFDEAVGVTGIVLTKLDSTARGGVLLAIAMSNPKPVLFVGVGESDDDLLPFDPGEFAGALLAQPAAAEAAS